jgi:hypothetical protein
VFVGYHPHHREILLYVFFGGSKNDLPQWALQAVGPANEGKKDGGRVIVNLSNIMLQISDSSCWARGIRDRMSEVSAPRREQLGPLFSEILRDIYYAQPEILSLPKNRKRKISVEG